MANRLAAESSPYLLQHRDNPVDWYPWGEEAFARARADDRPMFVSIGYAACHWCHVMEHESFEDPAVAALMNRLFVNIKVDREERPEVDAVYMNAIHVMGEGGGWPLSAFCDPAGRPFFVGTYFPPGDRHGRPGFARVLESMARVYRERRDEVEHNASAVLDGLRHLDEHGRRGAVGGSVASLEPSLLIAAARTLVQRGDPHHGGFGGKPKFPSSSAHALLARAARLPFGQPAREAFLLQCERMAAGGIYDHVGGGFARYSVDERWLVPHFEKMLYDSAQLLAIYGDAFALGGDPRSAEVIAETVDWLGREMKHPAGGLYASQDADSEGEEGKFYVWTPADLREALGRVDAMILGAAYDVTEAGNFEHETTVLARVGARGSEAEEAHLRELRGRLFEVRRRRVAPATDTKVLASWNGLAISGLLRAWAATGYEPARALALEVAGFLVREMLFEDEDEGDVRLRRVWKDGVARLDGTLEDFAFVARAFLDVAEATLDPAWWRRGARLARAAVERFHAEEDSVGVFYLTAKDAGDGLVHRPESTSDAATPSGAAVAVECLVRLAHVAGDDAAMAVAELYLAGRAPQAAAQPYIASRLLAALDDYLQPIELWVSEGEGRAALLEAARRCFAPTLMVCGDWAQPTLREGRGPAADGRAQAYVCRGRTCAAPTADPAALRALLEVTPG
jgi:uncharacterized protein YyaL (SSP411 family)